MFVEFGLHPLVFDPFILHFTPDLKNKIFLDCGCGKGVWGYLIKASKDTSTCTMIGLDSNQKVLDFCKKHKVYDRLVKCRLPSISLDDKSVDFLLACEIIEHLTRKEGLRLLEEIDRVCKGRAIITTPNVFFRNPSARGEDVHKSLWRIEDFRKRGFKVYGLGFKTVPKKNKLRYWLWSGLFYAFMPLSFIFPRISGFLICVKDYQA